MLVRLVGKQVDIALKITPGQCPQREAVPPLIAVRCIRDGVSSPVPGSVTLLDRGL